MSNPRLLRLLKLAIHSDNANEREVARLKLIAHLSDNNLSLDDFFDASEPDAPIFTAKQAREATGVFAAGMRIKRK